MKLTLACLCVVLLNNLTFGQCATEENIYSFSFGGKTYELITENKNWPDAAECAVERGGVLARIDSEEENTALYNALIAYDITASETTAPDGGGGAYVWIGGTDRAEEGTWIWDGDDDDIGDQFWEGAVDGSPVDGLYNNWGDEPDDFGDLQDGAAMSFDGWPLGDAGEWNDINDDSNEIFFFVEIEPIDDTGIQENQTFNFSVYPNPVSDQLYITLAQKNEIAAITIYNIAGKILITLTNGWQNGIDISDLTQGSYLLEIQLENGEQSVEKFVK